MSAEVVGDVRRRGTATEEEISNFRFEISD
jgi:hypothetical protein